MSPLMMHAKDCCLCPSTLLSGNRVQSSLDLLFMNAICIHLVFMYGPTPFALNQCLLHVGWLGAIGDNDTCDPFVGTSFADIV